MEISPYLDSHWLSTILESVLAIFIFLLGIPLLFAHIFMPEEIREIYNRRFQTDNVLRIRKFIIWVILFVLIFANHLIKNIIVNDCRSCIVPLWLLIFNISTLLLFIFFFLHVLKYLREVFFTKSNYFVLLLDKIRNEVNSSNSISTVVISDLQIICGATKDPNSRQVYLKYVRFIVNDYLVKESMDDSLLENYVVAVIKEAALENVSFHNERDLRLIYEINQDIILYINSIPQKLSCRFSIECLSEIGKLAIKLQKNGLLKSCLGTMYSSNNSYYSVLHLCHCALNANYIEPAVLNANKYLHRFSISEDSLEQNFCVRNFITLFAWIYNTENNLAKKYVIEKLIPYINKGSLSRIKFEEILDHYYSTPHDFFTASSINNLIKVLFP